MRRVLIESQRDEKWNQSRCSVCSGPGKLAQRSAVQPEIHVPNWQSLDRQMHPWGTRLRDDLRLAPAQAGSLATSISGEVESVTASVKDRLRRASPIPLSCRLDELIAFQAWMDMAHEAAHPAINRAQVITQNYVCFAYLKESWFEALHELLPSGTVTSSCCEFLLSEPLRRFRNAFAHGNWRYLTDFSGLEFWARARGTATEEVRTELPQVELSFWQTLSRCTAYSSMLTLAE
jgi:hypothetical protein